jgi:hypothetical protein
MRLFFVYTFAFAPKKNYFFLSLFLKGKKSDLGRRKKRAMSHRKKNRKKCKDEDAEKQILELSGKNKKFVLLDVHTLDYDLYEEGGSPEKHKEFKPSRLGLLSSKCKIKPWHRLLNFRFLFYIFLAAFISSVYAYVWHLILDSGFLKSILDTKNNNDLTFVWGFTSIAISIFMNKWLWDSINVYYDRIVSYLKLMNQIREFTVMIESNYNYETIDKEQEKTSNGFQRDIEEIKACVILLTKVSQYIFLEDSVLMYEPVKMTINYDSLPFNLKNLLIDHYNGKDPTSVCLTLLKEIQRLIMTWLGKKKLMIKNDPLPFVEKYGELLEQIEIDKTIQSFKVNKYVIIGVVIFNLLFLPVLIWNKLKLAIIVFYPILVVTFMAIPCLILWMGDPFEGNVDQNAFDRKYTERYILGLIGWKKLGSIKNIPSNNIPRAFLIEETCSFHLFCKKKTRE